MELQDKSIAPENTIHKFLKANSVMEDSMVTAGYATKQAIIILASLRMVKSTATVRVYLSQVK